MKCLPLWGEKCWSVLHLSAQRLTAPVRRLLTLLFPLLGKADITQPERTTTRRPPWFFWFLGVIPSVWRLGRPSHCILASFQPAASPLEGPGPGESRAQTPLNEMNEWLTPTWCSHHHHHHRRQAHSTQILLKLSFLPIWWRKQLEILKGGNKKNLNSIQVFWKNMLSLLKLRRGLDFQSTLTMTL